MGGLHVQPFMDSLGYILYCSLIVMYSLFCRNVGVSLCKTSSHTAAYNVHDHNRECANTAQSETVVGNA